MALAPMEDGKPCYVVYKVLVFGPKSSPTLWGRFAACLGRSEGQVYVGDPVWVVPTSGGYDPIMVMTKICVWAAEC